MKQNFQLHFFYGENENAIYTQAWCTLIAQLLLTVTQKIAQAKKAFSVVASLVRIHLISLLDVNELLRSTKRRYSRGTSPSILQLSLNIGGVTLINKNIDVDNQTFSDVDYKSKFLIGL